MPRTDLNGWLPVDLVVGLDTISVRWLEFGSKPLSEPFFPHTVRHLRSRRPPARERITDAQTLLEYGTAFPPVTPAGIIHHVSRCGSTFLSTALKTGREVVVLSEARPISTFFNPWLFRRSPFPAS